MRARLAAAHGAQTCCPLTTGVLLRAAAEAALEARAAGISDIAPFWRAIDEASPLAGKLSCGRTFVAQRRQAERAA